MPKFSMEIEYKTAGKCSKIEKKTSEFYAPDFWEANKVVKELIQKNRLRVLFCKIKELKQNG
jgi:hypothetical protein